MGLDRTGQAGRHAIAWLVAFLLVLGPMGLAEPGFGAPGLYGPGDICSADGQPVGHAGHDGGGCALHCAAAFAAAPPSVPSLPIVWRPALVALASQPGQAPRPALPASQHSPRGPPDAFV